MCGIAGIVGVAEVSADRIDAVSEAIAHRGPDGRGEWREQDVNLIHRRLSILDLDGGAQPMHSADTRYVVVYNGEIYNYPALRKSLEADGAVFRTTCDTEVLLHLYARRAERMVSDLRGMFAFAIWDRTAKELFMARDHIGQKPLFFTHRNGEFVFASEIKGILATGLVTPELDLNTLWHHTSLRFCPADVSLFRQIRKLRPGHALKFSQRTDNVSIQRYWQLDYRQKTSASLDESIEEGYALIRRVVKEHMLSDVPVGSFLSGGVDSSLVAALAQQSSDERLKTFSIGALDTDFSELPYSREAADLIDSDHHEFRVQSSLMKLLPDMIWHLEEPGDPHAVGLYQLSELTRQFRKVSLGGDGGDEVFGGYSRYTQASVVKYYSLLPAWVRKHVTAPMIRALPESFGYYSIATKARWVHDMSFLNGAARHYHAMVFFRFPDDMRERLFTADARQSVGDPDTLASIAEFYDSEQASDRIDKMLFAEQMSRMPEHYLLIADRMSMAHGLESRVPLVDTDLLEYSAALPSSYKIRSGQLKYILRAIAQKHYSEKFLNRTKQGFGFPMARWFRGELRRFVEAVMAESELIKAGVYEGNFVRDMFGEHLAGRVDHNFRIWKVINDEVWYRMFILGHGRDATRDWIGQYVESDVG